MAMKSKCLGFVAESCMFVGANHDNEGKMGMVTFSDHNEMTKKARQLTEQALEGDKAYQLLADMAKTKLGGNHILYSRAHETVTEIWSILWHNFLIKELEANGWTILNANSIDFADNDLVANHMQI